MRIAELPWSVSDGRMTRTSAEHSTCGVEPNFFTFISHQLVSPHPSVSFQLPALLLTQQLHQR